MKRRKRHTLRTQNRLATTGFVEALIRSVEPALFQSLGKKLNWPCAHHCPRSVEALPGRRADTVTCELVGHFPAQAITDLVTIATERAALVDRMRITFAAGDNDEALRLARAYCGLGQEAGTK